MGERCGRVQFDLSKKAGGKFFAEKTKKKIKIPVDR
jgi:hypothetical protein